FSRIKSTAANLTEDQARAKGYVKGRKKIEEQITALRRVTTPQTIYKTQKLDRDDVIDITDFDVVAWMKQEMRMMLDEELARAILVGDGRLTSDPEKIFQDNIRSIWADNEMYTIHQVIPSANATDYTAMIDAVVRSRKGYKGSGNPVMFIGPTLLTEMRLLKDNDNRFRYESDAKLAEAMRVKAIHEVELFDELTRNVEGKKRSLVAIIVNLADYTVGCNKGGEVNLFDNFDLDYNKYQYLIETRCSGALTMPKSAIAIEIQTTTDASADPVYTLVTSPATADIAEYFEQDEYGRYFATEDEAVVAGKRYYIAG
ncbi:MAG: phage major capsid protein, partial [Exiguobacterium sp.]|nr:phage major capsid protein [Exiguobacterium sp.]